MTLFSPLRAVKSLAPAGKVERPPESRRSRGPRRNRRFLAAVAISACFHLSMVTLFNIVVAFPREDLRYFQVSIVSNQAAGTAGSVRSEAAPPRHGDLLTLSGVARLDSELPRVALPVLEFAEMERLRIRYENPDRLPPLDGLFGPPGASDSWARFGGELRRLGQSLRGLAFSDDDSPTLFRAEASPRRIAHRPAEGFEAYVEWNTAPRDRELLFAPPIRALWQVNPADLHRPIEIVLKVDSAGRVVNVWSPQLDDDGLLDAVQRAVLQYRFAPMPGPGAGDEPPTASEHSGVLFIRPAQGAP